MHWHIQQITQLEQVNILFFHALVLYLLALIGKKKIFFSIILLSKAQET